MKRLKLLGLAMFAVFALGAAAAASASAETSLLPTGTAGSPVNFTVKSGEGKLKSALATITCKKDEGKGSWTSATLGTFEVTFLECTGPLASKCWSLDQAANSGIITVMGEFHLRMGLSGQPLGIITHLILHVHIFCGELLILVLGCAAGKVNNINELISSGTVSLAVAGGVQEITHADNAAETAMETCELTVEGLGKTVVGTEETEETLEKFEKNGSAVTALVHV